MYARMCERKGRSMKNIQTSWLVYYMDTKQKTNRKSLTKPITILLYIQGS